MSPREHQEDKLAGLEWEAIGGVGIDAGLFGFADGWILDLPARKIADAFIRSGHEVGTWGIDYQPDGVPMIAFRTGGDSDSFVEVARETSGRLIAARMELVNDIADLDGRWMPSGELELATGICIASDPCYVKDSQYTLADLEIREGWWTQHLGGPVPPTVAFPAPRGTHPIEVFEIEDDQLGIRILFGNAGRA